MNFGKLFSAEWHKLRSKKEKSSYLTEKLGGLPPAVLVVDDEPDFLEVAKDLFEPMGLECFTAEKPVEAMTLIDRYQARLVLIICDYRMPEINGLEWRRKSKDKTGDIPFVILSGFVDREMALEGLSLKISAFVEKPANEEKLIEVLTEHADQYALKLGEDFELLRSFIDDAESIIEQIEELFLELEDHPQDMGLINQAYGLLHTMKGNAGFFEPRLLHEFAHSFEDEIKSVQGGNKRLTSQMLSQWLKGLDILKVLVKEFKESNHQPRRLDQLTKVFAETPSDELNDQTDAAFDEEADGAGRLKKAEDKDIKVSAKLLDGFMQVSGEMTVIRNMINKTAQSLERRYSSDKDVQLLSELLGEMHKINSDIQNKVNDLRRVSVNSLLRPLTRTARDSAKALNKNIDLQIEGQQIRVDHSLGEIISRTLIHLIRNSVDHGLENSEVRTQIGKPEKGLLKLCFSEAEDEVLVEVIDDGKGIDPQIVGQKCVEKGLLTASELKSMPPQQVQMMIFAPGFSTAETTTQFSGRGVGMSMVKESVESIGGQLIVHSEVGKGSRFQMKLPVPRSALIEPCLFVQIRGLTYALPQSQIQRVLRPEDIESEDLLKTGQQSFLRLDGKLIAVIEAAQVLKLRESKPSVDGQSGFILILQSETGSFGLRVDEIFDIEDTVIKSFAVDRLKILTCYKGGTFLADGRVGLVLNVDGLAGLAQLEREDLTAKAEFEDSLQDQDLHAVNQRFLTFRAKGGELYSIHERLVLRIEQLAWKDLQKSGDEALVPYRGGFLHLVDFEQGFMQEEVRSVSLEHPQDPVWAVILRTEDSNQQLGLVVHELVDLEDLVCDLEPPIARNSWVEGYLMKDDVCRTLLNLDPLLNQVRQSQSEQNLAHDFSQKIAA